MLTSKTQLFPRRTEGVVNASAQPVASQRWQTARMLPDRAVSTENCVDMSGVNLFLIKTQKFVGIHVNNPKVREITALIKRAHSVDNKNKTIHRLMTAIRTNY